MPPTERERMLKNSAGVLDLRNGPVRKQVEKQARPIARSIAKQAPLKVKRRGTRYRVFELVQYPLIAGLALAMAYSSTVGQYILLVVAVFALVRRLDSRLTFGAALFLLVTVPLFQAIGQSGISENAAIYAYELLVLGTIQAVLELRKTGETAS